MSRSLDFLARAGVVAVLATATLWAIPQEQPRFRAGVHVVEVDVRVFDREGRFVSDLTREDFELVEDAVLQQVQAVYLVEQAGAAAAAGGSGSVTEVSTSPARAAPRANRRQTWVFLFDLNHLTPGAGFDRARKAVEEFIRDRFREGDLAGIVAGTRMVNNRLTSVREELVSAVRSVKPLGDERSRRMAEMEAKRRMSSSADRDGVREVEARQRFAESWLLRMEKERAVMETFTAINELASGLAKVEGPKTLVLLSGGFEIPEREGTLRNVVGQTTRAGARVYAVDVRGLDRDRGAGDVDRVPIDISDATELRPARVDNQAEVLNSLAVDTGGIMIRNENNISRALDQIAHDANRYYVAAYQPSNTKFDGKFRRLEVRVKRPDVRVRARRGYLALEPAKMLTPQPIKP